MKNKRPLFVVLLCLLLAGGVVLALIPCSPMPWQCSKLYWQYRGQEGIKATYVKQYPVDDTTLVDVTLLQATTDSAWESLCHEFVPYEFADSNKYINNLIHDTTSVTFRAVSKDDPHQKTKPDTTCDYNLLVISAKVKSVGIFQIETKSQFDVIFLTIADNMLHTNNYTLIQ
jgi:hypothetical protein